MIDHEFWKVAATGLVDGGVGSGSLLELLTAITDRDKRRRMIDCGAIDGHFRWLTYYNGAFGYAVDDNTVSQCWAYIADRYYNPHIRDDVPPKPQNVTVSEGTISADDPGEGYTLYVYEWDYVTFAEVGTLAEHNAPGSGVYVLVVSDGNTFGLPSGFITIAGG